MRGSEELHFLLVGVFVGHTPQLLAQVLDLEHVVFRYTYCFGNGCPTAMEVQSGQ